MKSNRSYRIRQAVLTIVAVFEEELDFNPTTAEIRDWFKSRPETQRDGIRRDIHKRKVAKQEKKVKR